MSIGTRATKWVGVCETQPTTAEGLIQVLSRTEDLACRWTSETIADTFIRAVVEPVDLLVLDGVFGLASIAGAIRPCKSFAPNLQILVWGGKFSTAAVNSLTRAGANGWISKTVQSDILIQCLRTVLAGGTWPEIEVRAPKESLQGEARLSAREHQVYELLLEGRTTEQISLELGMATGTVKVHCRAVYCKLRINGRHELTDAEVRQAGRPCTLWTTGSV